MFDAFSLNALAASWLVAVSVIVAAALALGVSVAPGTAVLLLMLCLLPPTIISIVVRRDRALASAVLRARPENGAGRS